MKCQLVSEKKLSSHGAVLLIVWTWHNSFLFLFSKYLPAKPPIIVVVIIIFCVCLFLLRSHFQLARYAIKLSLYAAIAPEVALREQLEHVVIAVTGNRARVTQARRIFVGRGAGAARVDGLTDVADGEGAGFKLARKDLAGVALQLELLLEDVDGSDGLFVVVVGRH